MESSTTYVYPPLDHAAANPIRFLDLLPSKLDGTICCELHDDQLVANSEPYEALSYTWGPEEPTYFIQLNGHQTSIRENLHGFLKVMSELHPGGYRRLWIDALCIDQSNVHERNQQVGQMGRVFSDARTTFIWLGPSNEASDIAFSDFERVRQKYDETSPSISSSFMKSLVIDQHFEFSILELLKRDYWTRVWIIQELFLATHGHVMCGLKAMDLIDLEEYCRFRKSSRGAMTICY